MPDPTQHWKVASIAQGIGITCIGHDKAHQVHRAVAEFGTIAAAQVDSFVVVADLREMTGYETESRVAWQGAFRAHRERIRGLILVGATSPLIKMGAAAVGAFAGIPVRFVATWAEVERALPRAG